MHNFSISIPAYSTSFRRSLSLPVIEAPNKNLKLSPSIKMMLQPGTPLSLSLDDALSCTDRFLSIEGRPDNPQDTVAAWLNLLRWELATYWESEKDWYDVRQGSKVSFSHEHPKRAGEMLAQGIAIRLLEKRFRLGRQRFYFLDASGARPDFLLKPTARVQRALLLKNDERIALEVRSRKAMTKVTKGDIAVLRKKKALGGRRRKFKAALSVYCSYGRPSAVQNTTRTQIILADPEGDGEKAENEEVARVVFGHYEGVSARLGFWGYRDRLAQVRHQLEEGSTLAGVDRTPITDTLVDGAFGALRETYFGQEYAGRFFSELLARASRRTLTQREVDIALARGKLGKVYFAGLRCDVLNLLRQFDHKRTAAFVDERGFDDPIGYATPTSDGTIRVEIEQATPDSAFGQMIIQSLRQQFTRLPP